MTPTATSTDTLDAPDGSVGAFDDGWDHLDEPDDVEPDGDLVYEDLDGQERHGWLLALSVLVAWIPTAFSVGWAMVNGEWMAGDRSIMGVFTHDVFTGNTPLVATVSTMGNYSDAENAGAVHHLGPAQFWAISIPDWITGGRPIGLLIGALWINLACIALAVIFVKRRMGIRAAAGAALVCTLLSYGLGPSLLRDIWTPFLGLWPLFALMILVWSLLDGDTRALPYAVVVATFLAQIELLFVAPAMVLSVVGGAGLLARRWHVHRLRRRLEEPPPLAADHFDEDEIFTSAPATSDPATAAADPIGDDALADFSDDGGQDGGRPTDAELIDAGVAPQDLVPLRRPLIISIALAVWLWSPVAWDELNGKPGNITLLWWALHEQSERAGWTFVWRNVVTQLKMPPVWVERAETPFDIGQAPTGLEKITAVLFVVALIAATVIAWRNRRHHPTLLPLMITCYGVLVAGFADLWITPLDGSIGLQYRRWLWPSGAYLWFAVVVVFATLIADRTSVGRLRAMPARVVVLPLLAVSLLVCIPAGRDQLSPPSADVEDNKIIESMWGPLLDRLPPQPTYVSTDGARSAFGVGPEIIRRMISHGFTVRIPPIAVDSYGAHRAYTEANGKVAQKLSVVTGDISLVPPGDPVELLAAGRLDGKPADSFVVEMQPILAQAQSSGPITLTAEGRQKMIETLYSDKVEADANGALDDLLNHPARAIFDQTLMGLVADGQATGAPVTAEEAATISAQLKKLGGLAFLEEAPPPEK